MFESKNIADKRLGTLESIVNQMILNQEAVLKRRSPLAVAVARMAVRYPELQQDLQAFEHERESDLENLYRLMDQWSYIGQRYKDQEAARIVGFSPTEENANHWASKKWIESLLRANSGLLECFGEGRHNLNADLPGNDTERYTQWLSGLENLTSTISDTRQSSILRDDVQGHADAFGGIPVYFINAGDFLHVIAMTNAANVQSLSVKHLPANWTWDRPEAWRSEMFSYLGNLSKETFLNEFAKALAHDGRPYLFVDAGSLDEANEDMELFKKAAEATGLILVPAVMVTPEDIAANAPNEADENDDSALILNADSVVCRMPWLFDESIDTSKLATNAIIGGVERTAVYPFPVNKQIDLVGVSTSESLIESGQQNYTDFIIYGGIGELHYKRDEEGETKYGTIAVDKMFTEEELAAGQAIFSVQVDELTEAQISVKFDKGYGDIHVTTTNPDIIAFSFIGSRANNNRTLRTDADLEE